ncbi:DNA-binding protein Alba [Candidatus Marsarchaeota archaeon]|nr:DNA-binding protein Alba [Candidatus Marsarchaeota archaeon]
MPEEYRGMEEMRAGSQIPENVVLVGKKPPMNYVLAVVTQFNNGVKSVKIRARGNSISRAVDVAEIARNRFVTDAKVNTIAIDSEEISNEDGTKSKVSSIEITLAK